MIAGEWKNTLKAASMNTHLSCLIKRKSDKYSAGGEFLLFKITAQNNYSNLPLFRDSIQILALK
jgi:hypothetical protein